MLKNFILIAFRTMMRNKAYSLINIAGLSIGVACCLLLVLYIYSETGYDEHHKDGEKVYRMVTEFHSEKEGLKALSSCSPAIPTAMRAEVPEVEEVVRLISLPGISQSLIKYENNSFYETDGYIADSTLFNVLTFDFIEGIPQKALVLPNTIVISEAIARKLFGNEPALNKVISVTQGGAPADFKITGVINKKDSHLEANFITSIVTPGGMSEYARSDEAMNEWAGQNFVTAYFKLRDHSSMATVAAKMNEVLMKRGADDMKALGFTKTLHLEPIRDIYLKSDVGRSPRIIYIYVIASIAVFILLIACINFMNLATAKATKRANEIGLRKVMGAFRSSLIMQILGEAMIIVLISIILSVVIVQLALPVFNQVAGKEISFINDKIGYFAVALVLLALFTGLVSGSYPAFYLSSFQPAKVLKGKFDIGNASGILRKSLVIFQFMIAIVLVCGMIIISRQLNFMQKKDLGFESQRKIVVPLRTESAKKAYASLKSELLQNSFVTGISAADFMPGSFIWNDMLLYPEGSSMNKAVYHPLNDVDYNYIDILNIKLLAGRKFTDNKKSEQGKIIVTRASAESFGFTPEQAIGQALFMDWHEQKLEFEIIGVTEDFHQNSLKEVIKPHAFRILRTEDWDTFENMIVNFEVGNFNSAIESVENTWKKVVNDAPFEYSFLEDAIKKQYAEDRQLSEIINSFTIIAMFISCLGLYGLSSYMAERRFKEIGVRKVMGASINSIVQLMSKEFVKLVFVAFILAVPLAWFVMNTWLASFAYKISIDVMIFLYSGLAALSIALLTVSFESIRAAMGNPVNALKNE